MKTYLEIMSKEELHDFMKQGRLKIDKELYQKYTPQLKALFTRMNNGVFSKTAIFDYESKAPEKLNVDDQFVIAQLIELGYEVSKESYLAGKAKKGDKEVNVIDVLASMGSKVTGYVKMKEKYDKTKNQVILKQLDFIDNLKQRDIIKESGQVELTRLSIYHLNIKGKYKIVFTMDFRAVASMSTSVGWGSCMNLRDPNKVKMYPYVGKGISRGMFVAYLTKAGDEYTLDNPTARVSFKVYKNKDGLLTWHVDEMYGHGPKEMEQVAQGIVDKYLIGLGKFKLLSDQYIDNAPQEKILLSDVKDFKKLSFNDREDYLRSALTKVESDTRVLKYLEPNMFSLRSMAININPRYVLQLPEPNEDELKEAIFLDPTIIKEVKDQTQAMKIRAVESDNSMKAFKYIQNPNDEVIRIYTSRNPETIFEFKNHPKFKSFLQDAIRFSAYPELKFIFSHLENPEDVDQETLKKLAEQSPLGFSEAVPLSMMNDELLEIVIGGNPQILSYQIQSTEGKKVYKFNSLPTKLMKKIISKSPRWGLILHHAFYRKDYYELVKTALEKYPPENVATRLTRLDEKIYLLFRDIHQINDAVSNIGDNNEITPKALELIISDMVTKKDMFSDFTKEHLARVIGQQASNEESDVHTVDSNSLHNLFKLTWEPKMLNFKQIKENKKLLLNAVKNNPNLVLKIEFAGEADNEMITEALKQSPPLYFKEPYMKNRSPKNLQSVLTRMPELIKDIHIEKDKVTKENLKSIKNKFIKDILYDGRIVQWVPVGLIPWVAEHLEEDEHFLDDFPLQNASMRRSFLESWKIVEQMPDDLIIKFLSLETHAKAKYIFGVSMKPHIINRDKIVEYMAGISPSDVRDQYNNYGLQINEKARIPSHIAKAMFKTFKEKKWIEDEKTLINQFIDSFNLYPWVTLSDESFEYFKKLKRKKKT